MTEGERVAIYNDLCDWRDELAQITYPSQTKRIDILTRAIAYVRGETAKWLTTESTDSLTLTDGRTIIAPVACSRCAFSRGASDFRFCPQCGTKIKNR